MSTTILKLSFLFLSLNSFAESGWFRVSIGAFVNSKQIFRGAEFFPNPSIFAGPAFTFFDQLQLRGPNLVWSPTSRRDKHHFELGLRYLDDGEPPLAFGSEFDEETDYRAKRSDAIETNFRYQFRFGFRNAFGVGFFYAKELNRHHGDYGEFNFRVPLYKFLSLNTIIGHGDLYHNQYVYGPTAVSGITHTQADINYMVRDFSWCDIAFLGISNSWVQQKENRNAFFIRGGHNQTVFSVRFLWFL